jgi:hypothetical protein
VTSERILQVSTWSTVVLAVSAAAAATAPDALAIPYAVLGVVYFLAGCAAFVWSYLIAVGRSRTEVLSVIGIYFLAGAAPRAVKVRLIGALVVQSIVVVAAAAVRPYTAVAFGVLAPMLGLGLTGLWGARFGTFPERADGQGRRPAA